ncbi:MAG: LamG-like jellyroll fold domain-containing protein [Candidatus Paceibacterota bacterium]|jgi:prepilin-type N-terminal cleavage/methylation domain-containing protein
MNFSKSRKGFTLIELLIVIGIVAVLAVVVLTVLNPVEFLKKSRDSRRMVDLQTLDKALRLADFDNISMGTANVVYVSIPDDTAATSTCPTLSLPALPGGWTYQCSNTTNYRKADGTGWVPVNFTSLTTVPNPLTLLPVDPTNSTSTNLYYSYVSGSWELTALFETTGYQTKYAASDNGTSTVLFEVGNHLKITPNAVASRTNTGGGGGGSSYTLTFNTSPTYSGSVTFDGSSYANGDTASKSSGSYNISGTPGSGRSFSYWSPTGMTVTDTSTLSTSATVSGAGSLSMIQVPDSYTKLLLHMDGTNGSTSFPDSSTAAHTVTANGTAQVTTAQQKFGTGSVQCNGSGNYLTSADSDDWYFGTNDFTVDFWARNTGGTNVYLVNQWHINSGGVSMSWAILWNSSNGVLILLRDHPGAWNDFNQYNTSGITMSSNTWYHIALVRYNNYVDIYVNGTSYLHQAYSLSLQNSDMNLGICDYMGAQGFTGQIDEVRISKGIARWTSNFTPPTAPY